MDMLCICSFFRERNLWSSSRCLPLGNPWSDGGDLYAALNLSWKHSPVTGSPSLREGDTVLPQGAAVWGGETALFSGHSHLMEGTQLLFLGTPQSEGSRKYRKQFKGSHMCQAMFYQLCPEPWRKTQQRQGPGRRFHTGLQPTSWHQCPPTHLQILRLRLNSGSMWLQTLRRAISILNMKLICPTHMRT